MIDRTSPFIRAKAGIFGNLPHPDDEGVVLRLFQTVFIVSGKVIHLVLARMGFCFHATNLY
jgi:hypothetical protein